MTMYSNNIKNNRYDFLTLTAANGECGTVQLYLCAWQGRGRTMIMCAGWREVHIIFGYIGGEYSSTDPVTQKSYR